MLKVKLFYSHLVDLEPLVKELELVSMQPDEREEIFELVDDIIHHRVLDSLLEILPEEDHEIFLERFTNTPANPEILEFLKEKAKSDPEVAILTVTEVVKREVLLDVLLSKPKGERTRRSKPSR